VFPIDELESFLVHPSVSGRRHHLSSVRQPSRITGQNHSTHVFAGPEGEVLAKPEDEPR
jgi:hypothetical protein